MFFDGKILVFSFNSGIWAKMFTNLVKTFRQAYQNCNLPVQWSILKFFLKWMIHIFSFHFEYWAKSIRFWRKNFGKVVKTRCLEEHFEEKCFFLFENLKNDFFPCLSGLFLKLGKTVAAVLSRQFFTCLEEHVEEKCFSFDENPFFYLDFEQKIFVFRQYIVGKHARTGFYLWRGTFLCFECLSVPERTSPKQEPYL